MTRLNPIRRVGKITVGLIAALLPGAPHAEGDAIALSDQGIVAIVDQVLDAWGHSDAARIAAAYEPTGDFVSPTGDHATGRAQIQAFYASAFAAGYAGSVATAKIIHLRHVTSTVAIADGVWDIQPTPNAKITRPELGIFAAVLVYNSGHWRIAALREQSSARELRDLP
jgi:uncharacterized protein (TIGR02246 family)